MVLKFETSGKSFTYNRNRRGPNVEPCGTSQVNLAISDLLSLITTYKCERFSNSFLVMIEVNPLSHIEYLVYQEVYHD